MSPRPASKPAIEISSSISSQCRPTRLISTSSRCPASPQQARKPRQRHAERAAIGQIDPHRMFVKADGRCRNGHAMLSKCGRGSRDDPQNTRKLPCIEAVAVRDRDIRFQPNLGVATAALHVNMRRFARRSPHSRRSSSAGHHRERQPACRRSSGLRPCPHEHPVVLPHVSHFMHVPLRTSVKFPHSAAHLAFVALGLGFGAALGGERLGVGLRLQRAGCAFELLGGRELLLGLGLERGGAGDFARVRGVAVTTRSRSDRSRRAAVARRAARPAPPGITPSLSVRERVSPFDTILRRAAGGLAFLDALAERVEAGLRSDRHGRGRSARDSSPRARGRRSRGSRSRT